MIKQLSLQYLWQAQPTPQSEAGSKGLTEHSLRLSFPEKGSIMTVEILSEEKDMWGSLFKQKEVSTYLKIRKFYF